MSWPRGESYPNASRRVVPRNTLVQHLVVARKPLGLAFPGKIILSTPPDGLTGLAAQIKCT
jgi:hypothetical protein